MPIGKVWIYRLLFVCLFFCGCKNFVYVCVSIRIRISLPKIKLATSNFARWFIGVLGRESHILGNFAPIEARNQPANRAVALGCELVGRWDGGAMHILGRLLRVDLIKWVSNVRSPVRAYVCPSTKSFVYFNEIWYVGRGRRVMHERVQYDPIQSQGQGHEPLKVRNSATF